MNEEKHKTLDDLLVDEKELNENLLVDIIEEYAEIGKESGEVILKPAFEELKSEKKVAVVVALQKARHELDYIDTEKSTPSELEEISGLKLGTIKPKVRELEKEGLLKNEDGSYFLPNYNLNKIKELIEKDS